jgi:hypothetical protein
VKESGYLNAIFELIGFPFLRIARKFRSMKNTRPFGFGFLVCFLILTFSCGTSGIVTGVGIDGGSAGGGATSGGGTNTGGGMASAGGGFAPGGGVASSGGGVVASGGGVAVAGGGAASGGGVVASGGGVVASGGGNVAAGGGVVASGGGIVAAGGGVVASGGGVVASGGGTTSTGTIDNALVVTHTLPAQLACNQTVSVTVTMRNTGDTTWSEAGNYHLGALDDTDPFTGGNRIYLGPTETVAPGQERTFTITLMAQGAGSFTTDWRMVRDGVAWFGGIATRAVPVACGGTGGGTAAGGGTATGSFYPCVINGQFNMPDHDQRIASRNTALLKTGHVITGNDAIDNAVLMGGPPDGGIWLSGQYHFEIDANGQVIAAASWITVFGTTQYPLTGGVAPNGEIHMGSAVAGLDISGLITNGMISGFVAEAGQSITRGDTIWNMLSLADRTNLRGIWHGNDISYVHGVMSGTWVHL